MKYTLYSTKLVMHRGKPRRQMISIETDRPWSQYAEYRYLQVNCTRNRRLLLDTIGDASPSWLCVARRAVQFADSSGLVARKLKPSDRALMNRAETVAWFDHTTSWSSGYGYGEELLLTEPYFEWGSVEFAALHQIGISAIRLPTNLSPYCGGWDPTPGAMPWTTSYLLCDASASGCLQEVEDRLNDAVIGAPQWNDISGIGYV